MVVWQIGYDWGALTRDWASIVCADLFSPLVQYFELVEGDSRHNVQSMT